MFEKIYQSIAVDTANVRIFAVELIYSVRKMEIISQENVARRLGIIHDNVQVQEKMLCRKVIFWSTVC